MEKLKIGWDFIWKAQRLFDDYCKTEEVVINSPKFIFELDNIKAFDDVIDEVENFIDAIINEMQNNFNLYKSDIIDFLKLVVKNEMGYEDGLPDYFRQRDLLFLLQTVSKAMNQYKLPLEYHNLRAKSFEINCDKYKHHSFRIPASGTKLMIYIIFSLNKNIINSYSPLGPEKNQVSICTALINIFQVIDLLSINDKFFKGSLSDIS